MPPDVFDHGILASLTEIDKMIHELSVLQIMAHLYVVESVDFLGLMNQTRLTRGNLSSHLGKLEKIGSLEIEKAFVGKMPSTRLRLTRAGRAAFETYRERMQCALSALYRPA